jgi:hypothetical protein
MKSVQKELLPAQIFCIRSLSRSRTRTVESKAHGKELYIVAFEDKDQAEKFAGLKKEIEVENTLTFLRTLLDEKYTAYGVRKYGIALIRVSGKKDYILKENIA